MPLNPYERHPNFISSQNTAFSRDVMSAILVDLNNEKSAISVYQISPVGVELFCNAKTFFCFMKQIWLLVT